MFQQKNAVFMKRTNLFNFKVLPLIVLNIITSHFDYGLNTLIIIKLTQLIN